MYVFLAAGMLLFDWIPLAFSSFLLLFYLADYYKFVINNIELFLYLIVYKCNISMIIIKRWRYICIYDDDSFDFFAFNSMINVIHYYAIYVYVDSNRLFLCEIDERGHQSEYIILTISEMMT